MHPISLRHCTWGALLALCFGFAQAATVVTEANPHPATLTAEDLGAFLDGYLPIEMERADIAGTVVTVVKDGKVLLARGYGYADRAHKTPVSPDTTLFRIGSVSKVFTWTAVMQLVDAGKLDLDADIQRYLDFPIPPAFGKPITLRNLMTHTSGFEETIQDMWAAPDEPIRLRDYLVRHVPKRIFAPGTTPAYSNYGATLAAYIVERVAHEPFEHYVDTHLIQPLGMAHTTFAQPLPAQLAPAMSDGYENGSDDARKFETIRIAPAGSVSASGTDMARFMLAQMGEGGPAADAVLNPATRARIQTPQFRVHPDAPPMGLGMWQDGIVQQRVISHGGDTQWFHTGMYLMPDQHVGVFFSQNSVGKHSLRDQLFLRFAERYFPVAPGVGKVATSARDASLDGWYITSRRSETSPMYLAALLSEVKVSHNADCSLSTSRSMALNDKPILFQPVGQGVWQAEGDYAHRLFFTPGQDGRWVMGGRVGIVVDQQVPWYQSLPAVVGLLAATLAIAGLTLLGWPIARLVRWHYGITLNVPGKIRTARHLVHLSAGLAALPWVILGIALAIATQDFSKLAGAGFATAQRVCQGAAWLSVLGVVAAIWAAWQGWRTPKVWWWTRIQYTLVAGAALGSVVLAWLSKLLFWSGQY